MLENRRPSSLVVSFPPPNVFRAHRLFDMKSEHKLAVFTHDLARNDERTGIVARSDLKLPRSDRVVVRENRRSLFLPETDGRGRAHASLHGDAFLRARDGKPNHGFRAIRPGYFSFGMAKTAGGAHWRTARIVRTEGNLCLPATTIISFGWKRRPRGRRLREVGQGVGEEGRKVVLGKNGVGFVELKQETISGEDLAAEIDWQSRIPDHG